MKMWQILSRCRVRGKFAILYIDIPREKSAMKLKIFCLLALLMVFGGGGAIGSVPHPKHAPRKIIVIQPPVPPDR